MKERSYLGTILISKFGTKMTNGLLLSYVDPWAEITCSTIVPVKFRNTLKILIPSKRISLHVIS